MSRHFHRSETITMSAGDAKRVNAVTHTIHPWPRYVDIAGSPPMPVGQEREEIRALVGRTSA